MSNISKIESIRLRSHFKSESGDFTPWLVDNLDYVSEAIHLKLVNPSTMGQRHLCVTKYLRYIF